MRSYFCRNNILAFKRRAKIRNLISSMPSKCYCVGQHRNNHLNSPWGYWILWICKGRWLYLLEYRMGMLE